LNIVYIHTHDSGRYVQPYGYNVPTPQLQALAEAGTVFRQAFSAAPTCSPSRAALLTGTAAHSCGMLGLAHRGFQLHDYDRHLARFLKGQGYHTVLCGEQHEAPRTEMIGYDAVLDMDNPKLGQSLREPDTENLGMAERDLRNARLCSQFLQQASGETPFFLSFGMVNTHRVFPELDGSVDPDFVRPPHPLPDTTETREDFARFMQAARTADACAGIVLDALKTHGHWDNTIVLFTTDHGLPMPRMKCSLTDSGIGVALLLRYPQQPQAGHACDALVSHLDVFPTLCDLAGLEQPHWLQGDSVKPLLEGKKGQARDEVFAEVSWHAAFEPQRAVRTSRYKYIRRYHGVTDTIPANIDESPSKTVLMKHDLLAEKRPEEALYDVIQDPCERSNLAYQARFEEVRRQLAQRLQRWMEETGDPLSQGPLQKPAGAVVNKKRCLSPEEEDFE